MSLIDIRRLKPIEFGWVQGAGRFALGHATLGHGRRHIRASADGKAFGLWRRESSPSGLLALNMVGTNAVKYFYEHNSAGHVTPSPNGNVICSASGLYTNELRPMNGEKADNRCCLPAVDGNYYLSFPLKRRDNRQSRPSTRGNSTSVPDKLEKNVTVHMFGDTRPIVRLPQIEVPVQSDLHFRENFSYDKRIHFVSAANLIITIPPTNDRLVLHQFDVEEALAKSGLDYLFVTSQPPTEAEKGKTYSYQIFVKSKNGRHQFMLESAPRGMAISDKGKITWRVPERFRDAQSDVIVGIRDATGQECFHTFTIAIGD